MYIIFVILLGGGVNWHWTFYGFETPAKNQPVQDWFDALSEEPREGIEDVLLYLQKTPNSQWGEPEFKPLGDGLFEIRHADASHWYRIYGFYWPSGTRQAFTFLHATKKKVKNDADGQSLARTRRGQLQRREAGVHKFNFEKPPTPATQ